MDVGRSCLAIFSKHIFSKESVYILKQIPLNLILIRSCPIVSTDQRKILVLGHSNDAEDRDAISLDAYFKHGFWLAGAYVASQWESMLENCWQLAAVLT